MPGAGAETEHFAMPRVPFLTLIAAAVLGVAAVAPAATPVSPRVLVVGDSLAVGMRPHLESLIEAREVRWDARGGRTTPQGMERLRARLRQASPDVVLISLGTNDGTDPGRFSSRMSRTLRAIPADACVVWADIHRPARKGAYAALNRVLRRHAARDGRLVVVEWERAVRRGQVSLPDGLHPDAAGYSRRSRMYAAAMRRCG